MTTRGRRRATSNSRGRVKEIEPGNLFVRTRARRIGAIASVDEPSDLVIENVT